MKCSKCGSNYNGNFCPKCGTPANVKKPCYTQWWFWLIIIFVGIIFIGGLSAVINSPSDENAVSIPDFSSMTRAEIEQWSQSYHITCNYSEDYSNEVPEGAVIRQSKNPGTKIHDNESVTIVFSLGKKPPKEYLNALKKAELYSDTMYMSKQAIYDQLISQYGEQFAKDAAQYAIDHINADWKKNALEKAKTYRDSMHMSKNAIYEQLCSSYGEKFTKEEAQYAVDHMDD